MINDQLFTHSYFTEHLFYARDKTAPGVRRMDKTKCLPEGIRSEEVEVVWGGTEGKATQRARPQAWGAGALTESADQGLCSVLACLNYSDPLINTTR